MSLALMMMSKPTVTSALEHVSAHPQGELLARFVGACLFEVAGSQNRDFEGVVARRAQEHGVTRESAATPMGNVIDALAQPDTDPAGSMLLAALLGRFLLLDPPRGVDAEDEVAAKLVWLSTETKVDALSAVDEVLKDQAGGIWGAVADQVQRHDARGIGLSRSEAVVAAAALATSAHKTAVERREELGTQALSPAIAKLLTSSGGSLQPVAVSARLEGELVPSPRGSVATFFLALCGWLFVAHVARLIGRFALQIRRPAEVELTPRGVVVRSRTRLLGRVLRETETVMPLEGMARAAREVRFPRLGMFAGLTSLALGSYIGISWFVDGLRASSFSLAVAGLSVMALGIGLDFVLMTLLPGRKGRCRVVFVPRKGATVSIGYVDANAADGLLRTLSTR